MALSLVKTLRDCTLALAVALTAGAQENDGAPALVFEFESATIDGNLIRAMRPRIAQGDLRIVADELLATSIEIDEASEWRFTGNVRLEAGTAVIEAESAVFALSEERLSRGELAGAPVSFRDIDVTEQTTITGHAHKMTYDDLARTLRMTGDPWVEKGRIEIQGCDLIYDFNSEGVTAGSPDCENPFRARVLPRDPDERAAAPAAPQ